MCKKRYFGLYCLKDKQARNVMETFDYVIIGIGIALIAIGVLLFISSKRDSQKSNQIEGFGIKLNVSNPSIILIVLGIGLVLFPRLMPNNKIQEITEQAQPIYAVDSNDVIPSDTEGFSPPQQTDFEEQEPFIQPPIPNVFLPQGTWYLSQYQQNGYDSSGNIQGSIKFNPRNNNSQDWYAELVAVDDWGNVLNYYYKGIINVIPGGYNIDTQSSNDPSFFRQAPSRLVMQMDNPNSLHMEYAFNNSSILIHWRQN